MSQPPPPSWDDQWQQRPPQSGQSAPPAGDYQAASGGFTNPGNAPGGYAANPSFQQPGQQFQSPDHQLQGPQFQGQQFQGQPFQNPGYTNPGAAGQPGFPQQVPPSPPSGGFQPPPQAHYGVPTQAPSRPLWNAFKPGVLALKPVSFGDYFSVPFSLIRFNPKGTLLTSLLLNALALIVSVPLSLLVVRLLSGTTSTTSEFDALTPLIGLVTASIPLQLAQFFVAPMVLFVTHEAVLGRKVSITEAFHGVKGRLLPYFGTSLIAGLIVGGPLLIIVGIVVLLVWNLFVGGDPSGSSIAGLIIGTLLALLLGYIAMGVLGVKLVAAGPESIYARTWGWRAIRRSWTLTKNQFWRIAGILLLMYFALSTVSQVLSTPLSFVFTGLTGGFGSTQTAPNPLLTTMLGTLAVAVPSVVLAPLYAIVQGIVTLDLKIRQEGYDVELMNRLEQPSAR